MMWSRHFPKMQPMAIPGTCLSVRGAWLGWWEEPARTEETPPDQTPGRTKAKTKPNKSLEINRTVLWWGNDLY